MLPYWVVTYATDESFGEQSMKSNILVTLAATLALTACTTTNPYTGQSQISNTAGGTLIGAGGGAGRRMGGHERMGHGELRVETIR